MMERILLVVSLWRERDREREKEKSEIFWDFNVFGSKNVIMDFCDFLVLLSVYGKWATFLNILYLIIVSVCCTYSIRIWSLICQRNVPSLLGLLSILCRVPVRDKTTKITGTVGMVVVALHEQTHKHSCPLLSDAHVPRKLRIKWILCQYCNTSWYFLLKFFCSGLNSILVWTFSLYSTNL
jgi:hypothetical protein